MTTLSPASTRRRAVLIGFAPFATVALVHLVAKAAGAVDLDHATKPLLMPALAIPVVLAARRGPVLPLVAALLAVLFSWLGDLTIGELVVGLAFFLVAHLAYSTLFLTAFRRRVSWWALAYLGWWIALVAALWPYLGGLRIPVIVYGLVLGATAALATRGNVGTTLGGLAFVASDTLLGLRLFTPWLQGRAADVVIMALYLAAQTLIVLGLLRRTRAAGPVPDARPRLDAWQTRS
ncbi:MAG: lysoplasmalogenase [Micrococcales bacterium]|nr:lysoplasmalogenase [Micrococcales bacterium]